MTLAVLAAAGQHVAHATLLSDIIAGNLSVQSGRLVFSNFGVTAVNLVLPNLIDVSPTVDANGNFGLLFTPAANAFTVGGDIVSDITFTVTTAGPEVGITGINQSISTALIGVIFAYDFTTLGVVGSPSSTGLTKCFSGNGACLVILNPTDDATLLRPVTSSPMDRQVQLVAARHAAGSGGINSYNVTYSVVVSPALRLSVTHADPWTQGQTGATYTITVSDAATAGPSSGVVTVTETLPVNLTLVSMSGTGWTCAANTCTRSDALAAGASYPPIAATVNVSATAASPLSNSVSATGGGSAAVTATDTTTVNRVPVLSIAKSHTGNFTQGQAGAAYTLVVSNLATAGPTNGTFTVTDTLPAGLTLVAMSGTGWACATNTCSRSDVLAAGASYPAITATVNVAANAATPQVNSASVSGGNSASASATDSTIVNPLPVLSIGKSHTGNFAQGQVAAAYTLVVSNAAAAGPTSGTVTVADALPAGLTLSSMSGTGWT
jgi:uncharacterized repeat protein (TIGR01451 family)